MKHLMFVTHDYAYEILRPVQAAARQRGDEVAWFLEPTANDQLQTDELRLRDFDAVKAFAPDAVLVPGNWVPPFFPGVKVQVFHGFGIEKKGHFRIRGWFDLYCTHGPLTTQPFLALAARHGHFAVHETGWPKTDALFAPAGPDPDWRAGFADPARPLILYAPTFSPSLTSAPVLAGEIAQLAQAGRWNWLVKFHPKMDRKWIAHFQALAGATLQVAGTSAINPLLRAADVLVSDTSSVVAEFLLLDKPAVTFRNSRPGPHLINFTRAAELEAHIERALERQPGDLAAARRFAEAMHPCRDGRSSERVLDAIATFINENRMATLKPKPRNFFRRLKMRRRYRRLGLVK